MFNQNELNEMTRRYQDWNAQFNQPFYVFQNAKPSLVQRLLTALRGVNSRSVANPTGRNSATLLKPVMSGK